MRSHLRLVKPVDELPPEGPQSLGDLIEQEKRWRRRAAIMTVLALTIAGAAALAIAALVIAAAHPPIGGR